MITDWKRKKISSKGLHRMSYCRFSSDAYCCELYAYRTDEGFEIHVASNRRVYDEPPPTFPSDDMGASWICWHERVNAWLPSTRLEPINLSRDGQTLYADTIEDFRRQIASLIDEGYLAPDGLLQTIDDDIRHKGKI